MLTIEQIKQVGIPRNISRLNNRGLTPGAFPNESINLYDAIVTAAGTSLEIDSLQTLIGVSNNTTLGEFDENIISDGLSVKEALQELESYLVDLSTSNGIYGGSGEIQDGTVANIVEDGVFFIAYSDGSSTALGVNDSLDEAYISGQSGDFSCYANNLYSGFRGPGSTILVDANDILTVNVEGVGIGSTPHSTSILDVQSTTKTFLPPRMTQTQRDAISAQTGSLIYNTTSNKLNLYTGAS